MGCLPLKVHSAPSVEVGGHIYPVRESTTQSVSSLIWSLLREKEEEKEEEEEEEKEEDEEEDEEEKVVVVITLTSSSLQPISRSQPTQWQCVSMKSGSSFSSPMSRGTDAVAPVSIWVEEVLSI